MVYMEHTRCSLDLYEMLIDLLCALQKLFGCKSIRVIRHAIHLLWGQGIHPHTCMVIINELLGFLIYVFAERFWLIIVTYKYYKHETKTSARTQSMLGQLQLEPRARWVSFS